MPYVDPEKRKAYLKRRREEDPNYYIDQRKRLLTKHPGYDVQLHRRLRAARPALHLVYAARGRARKAGIECTITERDINIPEICPALGIPIKKGSNGKVTPNSPSIDRIDPSKGYIPGNVQVISHRANALKGDASAEELRKIADYIDKYLLLN